MDQPTSPGRRNLVLVRAGKASLHPHWLENGDNRTWDLAVSAYDAHVRLDDPRLAFAAFYRGGKWDGIYQFLTAFDVLRRYDYFWLPDDDIDASATDIDAIFAAMRRYDLDIAQPALTRDSYFTHFVFMACPGFRLRYVNFIEIMVPCLKGGLLARVLDDFRASMSGFGMDAIWCRLSDDARGKAAILDDVAVRHTRPIGKALRANMARQGHDASREGEDLRRRYNLTRKIRPLVYAAIDDDGRRREGRARLGLVMAARYLGAYRQFAVQESASWKILQLMRRQLTEPLDLSPLRRQALSPGEARPAANEPARDAAPLPGQPSAQMENSPPQSASTRHRAFRLTPKARAGDEPFSRIRVEANGRGVELYVPNAPELEYLVATRGDVGLGIESDDFAVRPLPAIGALVAAARTRFVLKQDNALRFRDFHILAAGPKSARRVFSASARRMRKSGAAMDGPIAAQFPELLRGWRDPTDCAPARAAPAPASPSFAVVAHIYYEETWDEIAAVLRRLEAAYDLIVTTTPDRGNLAAAIRRDFPHAEIRAIENRGRDIRPFLVLLEEGRLDRYALVCKIHGKKAQDGGRLAALGAIWRRRMLFDLLAAPHVVARIRARFGAEPKLGMIGPAAYRYPSALCSLELSWGENRPRVLELASQMGVAPESVALDFFCGSMFWVRPQALRPLRELGLASQFAAESGKIDGALEHAVERLFPIAAIAAGYGIDGVDGFAETEAGASLASA